jgi:signal transduction histidine kinase
MIENLHASETLAMIHERARVRIGELQREVAERKRMEHQLRKEKILAEEKARNFASFLAGVSHELRTPLNAIVGFSELIKSGLHHKDGIDRAPEYAENILGAAGHLLELINDILDLSKIDAEKLELHEDLIEVSQLAEDAARMIRDRADEAGVIFEVTVRPDLPPVHADYRRMLQAVLNLLSNAIKFTPEGGFVSMIAGAGRHGGLEFRIVDTGVGMKPSDIPIALTEFAQVGHGLEQNHPSSGLGLPLAKRLMELHGGSLSIESEPGKGTSASLTLPPNRWRMC